MDKLAQFATDQDGRVMDIVENLPPNTLYGCDKRKFLSS
jgi:hypothetical protein